MQEAGRASGRGGGSRKKTIQAKHLPWVGRGGTQYRRSSAGFSCVNWAAAGNRVLSGAVTGCVTWAASSEAVRSERRGTSRSGDGKLRAAEKVPSEGGCQSQVSGTKYRRVATDRGEGLAQASARSDAVTRGVNARQL